ncbi:MAG: methyltransferase family protein, partial [Anaerolineales bacterium]
MELPHSLRLAALAFAALVIPPFVHWAQSSLGNNVSPTVITKENLQLVTNGPHRYIRHPLYTAGFLFWFSSKLCGKVTEVEISR